MKEKRLKIYNITLYILYAAYFISTLGLAFFYFGFFLWIMSPLIVFVTIYHIYIKKKLENSVFEEINLLIFVILFLIFPVFINIAWITDFQGMKTGSSTSALIFIFAPLWANVSGLIYLMLNGIIRFIIKRINKKQT